MQNQWHHLTTRLHNHQLPHALLLTNGDNTDGENFARDFSQLLLCAQKDNSNKACGTCHACKLFLANTHPDFYLLQPEAAGKIIRIDQIRDLIAEFTQTAHQGTYKVALINPAETMHIAAVNALLKTLEEPAANTVIMLLSKQPGLLPATIRSRCQVINFQKSNAAAIENNSSPQQQRLFNDLKSISQNKSDPIQIAASWMKDPLREIIEDLLNFTMDLIRLKSGLLINSDNNQTSFLNHLAQIINPIKLFSYLDRLYQLRQPLGSTANLNQQLLLEDLFCTWYEYTHT